jgi:hypothetical protein
MRVFAVKSTTSDLSIVDVCVQEEVTLASVVGVEAGVATLPHPEEEGLAAHPWVGETGVTGTLVCLEVSCWQRPTTTSEWPFYEPGCLAVFAVMFELSVNPMTKIKLIIAIYSSERLMHLYSWFLAICRCYNQTIFLVCVTAWTTGAEIIADKSATLHPHAFVAVE